MTQGHRFVPSSLTIREQCCGEFSYLPPSLRTPDRDGGANWKMELIRIVVNKPNRGAMEIQAALPSVLLWY